MKKTRDVEGPGDWTCPIHKKTVEHRTRFCRDKKTGKSKYGGEYFSCPDYADCGYYVSPTGKVSVV